MKKILFVLFLLTVVTNICAEIKEEDFRNIFAHNIAQKYPDAELARLVLKTPEVLLTPIESNNELDFIKQFEDRHNQYTVSDFYNLSKETPFKKVNEDVLLQSLKSKKIIYFFIPGIVGELITGNSVLTEILNRETTFKKSVQQYLKNYKKETGKKLTDPVFKMHENKIEDEKLENLIFAGSIDDEDQVPLVKLAYLFPQFLSLETFEATKDRAAKIIRRIDKFIKLIEQNESTEYDFVIIGYSQGGTVALEIASQLGSTNSILLKKLKAVVSYAGVIWGSDLADLIMKEDGADNELILMNRQIKAFKKMLDNLQTSSTNPINYFQGILKNKATIIKFLHDYLSESEESIKTTDAKASFMHLVKTIMRIALVDFKVLDVGLFHYQNVRKLKKFGEAVMVGLNELTTQYMENWHRTHVLPAENVHYYGLTGVAGDLQKDKEFLRDSEAGMDIYSFDFQMLQNQFITIVKNTNANLNDCQVSMQRIRFWPALAQLQNPAQSPYEETFLGSLGTHHWGVTFDFFNVSNPKSINNFKRPELLLSLAQAISLDIDRIESKKLYQE